jgi:hypothetical protein
MACECEEEVRVGFAQVPAHLRAEFESWCSEALITPEEGLDSLAGEIGYFPLDADEMEQRASAWLGKGASAWLERQSRREPESKGRVLRFVPGKRGQRRRRGRGGLNDGMGKFV